MTAEKQSAWSILNTSSPYKYGDRVVIGGSNRTGVVTGFIGKKKETIIVQFDDNPSKSVPVSKSDVTEVSRKA